MLPVGIRFAQTGRMVFIAPGEETMKLKSMDHLFLQELRDLYSAENQLLKASPKLAHAADHPALSEAFEAHLDQTRGHVERLDRIFNRLGARAKGKKCKAMEG